MVGKVSVELEGRWWWLWEKVDKYYDEY